MMEVPPYKLVSAGQAGGQAGRRAGGQAGRRAGGQAGRQKELRDERDKPFV